MLFFKQSSAEAPSLGTPLSAEMSTTRWPDQTSRDEGKVSKGRCRGLMLSLRRSLRKSNVWFLITCFLGVVLGLSLGFGLRPLSIDQATIMWVGLPGELYMRMLQATILPLIICSVIAGTANMDPAANGRVSSVSLGYIVFSNGVGAVIAVIFTLIIRPGIGSQILEDSRPTPSTRNLQTPDIIADLIRNLFPANIVSACFEKTQTVYVVSQQPAGNGSLANNASLPLSVTRSLASSPGTNLLGLIIFCSVIGMATAKAGEAGRHFLLFFRSATDVITQALQWLVWFTPLGVASLIASSLVQAPDIHLTFRGMGFLVLTVTTCVGFHQLIFMQLVYFLARRRNPLRFLLDLSRVWITAFAPPNTVLTLPEMIRCCDFRLKVDKQISRFVLPLAVTLNRDGSCMFITAATIYIGQLDPVGLNAAQVVLIAILATIGSLAVPAVPSSSVVTVLLILSSLSIPVKNIGLIMAMEWFQDRIRTTSNACGCVLAAVVTERLTLSWLKKHREETAANEEVDVAEPTKTEA